jgi:LacI family transcriptional regulator
MMAAVAAARARRATLKDVAQLAGTSVATASRVLAGAGLAADETRRRIEDAAQTLNYQPNLQARALRRQSSRAIGLVMPNLLNAGYTALADAAGRILAERGYHLLLSPTGDDPHTEAETLRDMVGQNVDGLILVPSAVDKALVDSLVEHGVPAVAAIRRVPGDGLDTVTFEDFAGAVAATHHLLSLGHLRIGYIGGDVHHSSNQARWQGYLAALREHNLPAVEELIRLGALRNTWGAVATANLMRIADPPTALFVASIALIPGVLATLQSYGIVVPDDVSLICFDDVEWFSFTVPKITAISSSQSRLAEAAVTLLLTRIEESEQRGSAPSLMEIKSELMLRGSTASPRQAELVLRVWNGDATTLL